MEVWAGGGAEGGEKREGEGREGVDAAGWMWRLGVLAAARESCLCWLC